MLFLLHLHVVISLAAKIAPLVIQRESRPLPVHLGLEERPVTGLHSLWGALSDWPKCGPEENNWEPISAECSKHDVIYFTYIIPLFIP